MIQNGWVCFVGLIWHSAVIGARPTGVEADRPGPFDRSTALTQRR